MLERGVQPGLSSYTSRPMRMDELDYELPPELIATQSATPRDAARLMVIHRQADRIEHLQVRDLPRVLRGGHPGPADLMVMNNSKVIPALLTGVRAGTGGNVSGLYIASQVDAKGHAIWEVMLESRGTLQAGESITLGAAASLELLEPRGGGQWLARLHSERDTLAVLEQHGSMPLPPYIRKQRKQRHQPTAQAEDVARYNTVYAASPGSVAAPTAGLHFTPELLQALSDQGVLRQEVTLHVGLGTFAPVRVDDLSQHRMHSEWFEVSARTLLALRAAREEGRRILAVGTTTVRALESLPEPLPAGDQPYHSSTELLIAPGQGNEPGFRFRYTDALMTNFHLPRSTLMALVAALPGVGIQRLQAWYRLAIGQGYRFYSFGDAMLIL